MVQDDSTLSPGTSAPGEDLAFGKKPAKPSSKSAAPVKVELDLEDAPFLADEDAPPPPAKAQAERLTTPLPPKDPAKPSRLALFLANKKRLAIIAGVCLFILLMPLVFLLLFGEEKTPPPPEPVQIIKPGEPPRENAPAGPQFTFKLDTFLVERKGTEGEIRFLRCRFTVATDNSLLFAELQTKNIALRDSIYYYLNNKPLTFLVDQNVRETLRQDLISVINEHISAEKIQTLYIEEYFVSGK